MGKKLTYLQKSCVAKAAKLMAESEMLYDGARRGVAVSGGVDSGLLLKLLTLIKKRIPFRIELMAIHINPGFDPKSHIPLVDWLKKQGVSSYVEVGDMGPRAHTEENQTNSPCFFCSWRRRKRLFELVNKFNLTHLALGHTGDDLVSTFFMNLFYNGRVESLYPKEIFFKGEFLLVRPLLLLEKAKILKVAKEWNIPVIANPCPFAQISNRSNIARFLEKIWTQDKRVKKNIFSALYNWVLKNPMPAYGSR